MKKNSLKQRRPQPRRQKQRNEKKQRLKGKRKMPKKSNWEVAWTLTAPPILK